MSVRYTRNAAAEAAPMQDETMVFHATRNQFCVLNHTAALLWEQLASPQTPEELASALQASYTEASVDGVLPDVLAALREMESLDLVTTLK